MAGTGITQSGSLPRHRISGLGDGELPTVVVAEPVEDEGTSKALRLCGLHGLTESWGHLWLL